MADRTDVPRIADVPRITVIVVLYHSEAVLPGLLESLPAAFASLPYRVVAVDNSSDGAGAQVVRAKVPEARVIRTGANLGYAAGINEALAHVPTSDAVLVLNPDIRLAPGSVVELAWALRRDRVGIAVPRIATPTGALFHSLRREPSIPRALADALLGAGRASRWGDWGEIDGCGRSYDVERDVAWATGAAMLFSPVCRRAVEPWDASYFLYSEEVDVCLRARDAGFTVRFTPAARVTHLKGESQTRPDLWALLVANRIECYRRRHSSAAGHVFGAVVLLRELTRAFRGSRTSRYACRILTTPHGREALIARLRGAGGAGGTGRADAGDRLDERPRMTHDT